MVIAHFPKSYKIWVPFAVAVTLLTLFMPRRGQFEYNYERGGKWNYETLVAPFNFPILKTSEQIETEKERLGSECVPYYRYDSDVFAAVKDKCLTLLPSDPEFASEFLRIAQPYFERGILPDIKEEKGIGTDCSVDIVFLQKEKRASKYPRSEFYTRQQARTEILSSLSSAYAGKDIDRLLGESSIMELITSNLVFDRKTTELVHQESSEFISPTCGTFKSGDVIVSSGEIITADIEQILDSYQAEYKNLVQFNGSPLLILLGNFLIAFILTSLVFCFIWFSYPALFDRPNEFTFILTVFTLASVVSLLFCKLPSQMVLLVPYPVFALFYMAFYRKRLTLPMYSIALLPLLIFAQEGRMLYILFLVGGYMAIWTFTYFNKGWKQFASAIIIFLVEMLVCLASLLVSGNELTFSKRDILYLFLSSVFCPLIYQLVYLFEIVFRLVSANRLVDLADTSLPLLRKLAEKAPGTFQHSLAVMNMADACGRAVDADIPLIRAAALYHDIGKMENPQCFIENQTAGVDYHANLQYKESAQDIIKHVTDGVALAEHHGVPSVIRDFILSHHGDSTTGYFLNKYLNDGGNPDDIDDFKYPGPRPKTKEQVILMLCDSAEAASRTLKDYSPESIDSFVHSIYSSKYHDNQLMDADITLREIEIVVSTMKSYMAQVHHGRIAYPKRKK